MEQPQKNFQPFKSEVILSSFNTLNGLSNMADEYREKMYIALSDAREQAKKLAEVLTAEYSHLIDKKVSMVTVNRMFETTNPTYKTIVGYFGGFISEDYNVYPLIYKEKKDGTQSKLKFSTWDTNKFDRIISFDLV